MKSRVGLVFWISSAAFLAVSAAAGVRLLHPLDRGVLRLAQGRTSATLDDVGGLFSVAGDLEYAGPAVLALVLGLAFSGRRKLAWRLLVAFLAAGAIELAIKFALPTPPMPLETARSFDEHPIMNVAYPYPYPSGHMLRFTFLLGAVVFLSPGRPLRALAIALAAALLAGMAATRVYLGVHWASDVVGGALLAVAALAWAFGGSRHRLQAEKI